MVRVTFLHPDLGIGGAERLVVDAALALKRHGHEVNLVTTRYDGNRSFVETTDGSLPAVRVVGSWLPRQIFGKFFALCAYIRMVYAAMAIYFMGLEPDVVFCDLVSICVPVLQMFVPHVVFYCHHPDRLLAKSGGGRLRSLYRVPLDYLEERTTGGADKVLVNSLYTQSVFRETFRGLSVVPQVLYPSINTALFEREPIIPLVEILGRDFVNGETLLLSINRYERKKNLPLAIQALAEIVKGGGPSPSPSSSSTYLVMAGGYDQGVSENVEHYEELRELAKKLGVEERTMFLKSPSDLAKISLLKRCTLLIYTPSNEHFGIVPLEAMYCKKAVVATNTGGPRESVINGESGYLVEPSPEAFAGKIRELTSNESLREAFGRVGYKTFQDKFSFEAFARRLNGVVTELAASKQAA